MNPLLVTGMIIVVFALGSYTTAIITQIRRRGPTANSHDALVSDGWGRLGRHRYGFHDRGLSQDPAHPSWDARLLGTSIDGDGPCADVEALPTARN